MRSLIVLAVALLGAGLVLAAAKDPSPTPGMAGSTVEISFANGHGSGVHIGNGYVLTAAHVAVNPGKMTVVRDNGETSDAETLWTNTAYDVALLRVDPKGLASSPLSCRKVVDGEEVTSRGNPMSFKFLTYRGYVASSARFTNQAWKDAIVLDIGGAMGISGGPVFDRDGDVVGIYVGVGVAPVGFGGSLFNTGIAVPSTVICMLMGRA